MAYESINPYSRRSIFSQGRRRTERLVMKYAMRLPADLQMAPLRLLSGPPAG
jgi:hypothetical protein